MLTKQERLDFLEGFLTVAFAGGAVGGVAFGAVFPGWWMLLQVMVPTLGLSTLAGVRAINRTRKAVEAASSNGGK